MEEGNNWQDRCERYFTSLTDSDKQRQKDNKFQPKELKNEWRSLGAKSDNSKRAKTQYWLKAVNIHGFNFAGSSRNGLECSVWVLISLVATVGLAFMLFLAVSEYIKQDSYLLVKSSSVLDKKVSTTFISVCNLNLFKRSHLVSQTSRFSKLANINSGIFNAKQYSSTKQLLQNKNIWSVLHMSFGEGIDEFLSSVDQDFVPYAGMTTSDDWESLYGASRTYGVEIWRDAVRPSLTEIPQLGHQPNDMVVHCRQGNGRDCRSR